MSASKPIISPPRRPVTTISETGGGSDSDQQQSIPPMKEPKSVGFHSVNSLEVVRKISKPSTDWKQEEINNTWTSEEEDYKQKQKLKKDIRKFALERQVSDNKTFTTVGIKDLTPGTSRHDAKLKLREDAWSAVLWEQYNILEEQDKIKAMEKMEKDQQPKEIDVDITSELQQLELEKKGEQQQGGEGGGDGNNNTSLSNMDESLANVYEEASRKAHEIARNDAMKLANDLKQQEDKDLMTWIDKNADDKQLRRKKYLTPPSSPKSTSKSK